MGREEGEMAEEGERERRPHRRRHRRLDPGRTDASMSSLAPSLFRVSLKTVRGGCFRAFPSGEPRKVLRESEHTSDPVLELCPFSMSEFHRHPNTRIRTTKFQINDSKPSFRHPNRPLGISFQPILNCLFLNSKQNPVQNLL
jgi:hypothetical protein